VSSPAKSCRVEHYDVIVIGGVPGWRYPKSPCRLEYGVATLPLGTPVELEVILEVSVV
jgi:hypothetical protein